MDFVEHNLKISHIKTGYSSIYRIDQMHGPDNNPNVSTVFLTDDDIKGLVQSWLMNSSPAYKDWLDALEVINGAAKG